MGKQIDFSGSWRGFYEQGGSRHGISMIVAQRGQSVIGRMRDDDTLMTTAHPQELILEPRDVAGAGEDEDAKDDDAATANAADLQGADAPEDGDQDDGDQDDGDPQRDRDYPVLLETIARLPEFSTIEGDAVGTRLSFEKRYLGTHEVSTWIDGHAEAHYTLHDHRVRYEGRLDAAGQLLVGRWLLGPSDGPCMSGAFELWRQPADEPAHD